MNGFGEKIQATPRQKECLMDFFEEERYIKLQKDRSLCTKILGLCFGLRDSYTKEDIAVEGEEWTTYKYLPNKVKKALKQNLELEDYQGGNRLLLIGLRDSLWAFKDPNRFEGKIYYDIQGRSYRSISDYLYTTFQVESFRDYLKLLSWGEETWKITERV